MGVGWPSGAASGQPRISDRLTGGGKLNGRGDRRVAGQGEDDQQVSRRRLHRHRLVWPCPRPAAKGRLGAAGSRLRHGLGGRRQGGQAHQDDRRGGARRRAALSRHRPRPRGRGDLLARLRGVTAEEGAARRRYQARGLQRDHPPRHPGCIRPAARSRSRACRSLPGAPGARLPCRVHALAGVVAQTSRQSLRRPRAVGCATTDLRARNRDREFPLARVLDRRKAFSASTAAKR